MLLKLKYDSLFLYNYLALLIVVLAFLMVSTITYPKQAPFLVPRNRAIQYIFMLILLLSLVKLRPTIFLFAFFLAYVLIGPLNVLTRHRLFQAQVPREHEEAVT